METVTKEGKKKRLKKVFGKFDDITHLWANQTQEEASCRNGYFEDNVIYSYGRHFPIARIYTDKKGLKTVFFTTDTYSSTTAQHISSTRWACNHLNMLYMKDPILVDNTEKGITWEHSYHDSNMMDFVRKINTLLEKFPTQREGKEWSLRQANEQLGMLNKYIDFFGLKTHLPKAVKSCIKLMTDPKWQNEIDAWKKKKTEREEYYQEHKTEIDEKRDKEKARKKELAIAKALMDAQEKVAEWRVGAYKQFRYEDLDGYTILRYNKDKNRIETSQGIEVPAESAHKFYRYIKAVISRGSCITTETCKYDIVGYEVKHIDAELLVVGCHRILQTEVEAIASLLKWNENG